MSIFDLLGIRAIFAPTSSYKNMLDKIESNKEDVINDCVDRVESVEPEQDFNDLVADIMNDFDNSSINSDKHDS